MPWISAGASILGGLFGNSAAEDAAAGQAAATNRATDLQKYIYDNNVKLNQGAIDAGNLGRNKLLYLLGLGGNADGSTSNAPTRRSSDQLRQSLLAQYTTPGTTQEIDGGRTGMSTPTTIDENGLSQAIAQAQAGDDSLYKAWQIQQDQQNSGDPAYGSLSRDFTGADLQNEPGYQFGLAEGNKGLDRKAAAAGGYFSGAALKAASRYNQDYAGTKYNDAFNRDTTNKTNTYNRLTGLTGAGQVSANQVGTAGQNYANNTGNLLTANADAQGAAGISQANTWGDMLTTGANALTRYNEQNKVRTYGRGDL